MSLTEEEVEAEFWAYHYADSDATEEFEDDDFEAAVNDWEEVINDRSRD